MVGNLKKRFEIKEMRALSIAQPWAECIVSKGKNIENRSWNTKFRGFLLIHASGSKDKVRFQYCYEDYGLKFDPENLAFGSIVGIAELSGVVTKKQLTSKTRKWFYGEYGFVLTNIIKLKNPVAVNGALSFWKLKGAKLEKVLSQVSQSQQRKISKNLLSNIDKS